jgi:conjugal transfer/entry exclusion protein
MESHEFLVIHVSGILQDRKTGVITDKQALYELVQVLSNATPNLTFLSLYDVGQIQDVIDNLTELDEFEGVQLKHTLDKQIDKLYDVCDEINITLL